MKKTIISLLLVASIALASCGGSDTSGVNTAITPLISFFKDAAGTLITATKTVSETNAYFTVTFSKAMDDASVEDGVTFVCDTAGNISLTVTDEGTANTYKITPATLAASGDTCTMTFMSDIEAVDGELFAGSESDFTIVSEAEQAENAAVSNHVEAFALASGSASIESSFKMFMVAFELLGEEVDATAALSGTISQTDVEYERESDSLVDMSFAYSISDMEFPIDVTYTGVNYGIIFGEENMSDFTLGGTTYEVGVGNAAYDHFTGSTPSMGYTLANMVHGSPIISAFASQNISTTSSYLEVQITDDKDDDYVGVISFTGDVVMVSDFVSASPTITFSWAPSTVTVTAYNDDTFLCTGVSMSYTLFVTGEASPIIENSDDIVCTLQ